MPFANVLCMSLAYGRPFANVLCMSLAYGRPVALSWAWSELGEMLTYPFMVKAFLVGTCLAICAGLLGETLVVKHLSFMGDGLSHVAFGAMALATVWEISPFYLALPVVLLAAIFLLRRPTGAQALHGDAVLALMATGSLALGVTVISLKQGLNLNISSYLFGSILSLGKEDVAWAVALGIVIPALYILFYPRIFALTFDETFAKACGVNTERAKVFLAFLMAPVILLGLRLMGALLISGLLFLPAITAQNLAKSYKGVLVGAVVVAVLGLWGGLTLSFIANTPAGASVILCLLGTYGLSFIPRRFPRE